MSAGAPRIPLRLGTRGSRLARVQAGLVAAALERLGRPIELVPILTAGDRRPPDEAWGEGAFVGALGEALLAGEIDLAVHSAKDVPLAEDERLVVAAYPERADARDALVTREGGATLEGLPGRAIVGTDSPRRTGFLRALRRDLQIVPLHGNVDTRIRRLDAGEVDALVLAVAGLVRLGRAERIDRALEPWDVPPAPGQGALAVQVRRDDRELVRLVGRLDDPATRLSVGTERRVLATTGGGCRAPVGACASVADGRIQLVAGAVEPDGTGRRIVRLEGSVGEAERLARTAGEELLAGRVTVA